MRNLVKTRKEIGCGRATLWLYLLLSVLGLAACIYVYQSYSIQIDKDILNGHSRPLEAPKRSPKDYPRAPDYTFSRVDIGITQPCVEIDDSFTTEDLQPTVDKLAAPALTRFGTSSSPIELEVIQHISKFHQISGICGPVVEIGVYKGWFVSVLSSLLARDTEKVFAFDLYGKQEENVDNSGGGQVHAPQIEYFWTIVDQVNVMDKVITVQSNSLDLSADEMLSMVGWKPRFVSVDGGHFRIAAFHDLNIVSRILHPRGIVALDDYNNAGWKGVKIAISTFMAIWPQDLQPFLATDAKLYLCKKTSHKNYLSMAQQWFPDRKVCPGQSLNLVTDDRVKLNLSQISQFVDQTSKTSPYRFC